MTRLLILMLVCLASASASAQETALVDFDDLRPGEVDGELRIEDAGGSGIDVEIAGLALTVTDLFVFAGNKDVRGNALITWSWPQTDGIMVTFSKPVTAVSITAGDFGGDADGPLQLWAYDCSGKQVGYAEAPWSDHQMPPFAALAVRADAICSARYASGGEYAGSAFMDNLSFTH